MLLAREKMMNDVKFKLPWQDIHYSDIIMSAMISLASQLFMNCLFRRRTKKTSKLHLNGICEGNSLVTGEFPIQRASNSENVSIW